MPFLISVGHGQDLCAGCCISPSDLRCCYSPEKNNNLSISNSDMKRFLILLFIFVAILIAGFVAVLSRANENTDEFYYRFATPKQSSLVIGTSRAAQGINPSIINAQLGRTDLFNYAFTNDHSPYGAIYLRSIREKLNVESNSGIFILAVDPWCLSSDKQAPEDEKFFRENGLMLDQMPVVDMHPNVFYLMKFYQEPYSHLLTGTHNAELVLKRDGWLEVNVPMDSAAVQRRTVSRMNDYREKVAPAYAPSNLRMHYLIETIAYLKKHGNVYLVRLPVSAEMKLIEDDYYPAFDEQMTLVSSQNTVSFLNLRKENMNCTFTDGNHLSKYSAHEVSERIATFIKENTKQ